MVSSTHSWDDASQPNSRADSASEMDQAMVHHYIRVYGRTPTPEERQSGAVSIPAPRRPGLGLPPLRRNLARLLSRL